MNWREIDRQRDPGEFANFLASANNMAQVAEYKQKIFENMQLGPGMKVLDVGCGLGLDALTMSQMIEPGGLVVGADSSTTMLQLARQICKDRKNLKLVQADAYRLSFPDENFDRTRTDRVLQHLRQPELVVSEMVRVTTHGGLVCCAEPDWRTLVIDSDDSKMECHIGSSLQARIQNVGMGSRLKAILTDCGLRDVKATGYTLIFESLRQADAIIQLRSACRMLVDAGKTSAGSAQRWLKQLRARDRSGRFFASISGFCAIGIRP